MPPLNLYDGMLQHLSGACAACRTILGRLIPYGLHRAKGHEIAMAIGFTSRGALTARLEKHGFRGLHILRDWILFLHLIEAWESQQKTLARWAYDNGIDLSVCHHAVKRATGRTWSNARSSSLDFWLDQFSCSVWIPLCHRFDESGARKDPASIWPHQQIN